MFGRMVDAKNKMTPKTGVNLCQIDPFDDPPDNIVLIDHFPTMEDARSAVMKMEPLELGKYVLIDSNGYTLTFDDRNLNQEPPARTAT